MFGISIDDRPDAPVGSPATRRAVAIHWNWTTEYEHAEMARALGVTDKTIRRYVKDGPTQAVREKMEGIEADVRMIAVAELKDQLRRAGHKSRTAEKPVKVWTDGNGDLHVEDKINPETGQVAGKYAVPDDIQLGADEKARFYARTEVREIIDQLTDLTGAGEPEQYEHTGPGGGPVQVEITNTVIETDGDRRD